MRTFLSRLILAAAFGLLFGGIITIATQQARALPAYAQQTGLACGGCHSNPAGGGALTPTGQQFKDNGHKMPEKK